MPQSLTELLGTNAIANLTTITIDLNDFIDSNGNPLLADAANASDQQKVACLIDGIWRNTQQAIDTDGNAIIDKTNAIVAVESFQPKTFETREDETQVRNNREFAIYSQDTTTFDPDNVI